jgi:AraC-like DNA-binding protein
MAKKTPDNDKKLLFQVFDSFPVPIEVFAPDGTSIFINKALIEINTIPDASLIVGKYNVLHDPVWNDQMGLRDITQRVFNGESILVKNIDPPAQDLVDRGVIAKKPFEKSTMDFHLFPIMNGRELNVVVCVIIVKKLYYGRQDLANAMEYLDSHWDKKFNPKAVASVSGMSVSQLYSLFNRYTGMTPGYYHKKSKVKRIMEQLDDDNVSIKEAFAACGEDSRGWFLRVFREITGMSPKQYKEAKNSG